MTPLYQKLARRLSIEDTALTTVKERRTIAIRIYLKIDEKLYKVSTGCVLPAVCHLGK